MDGYHLLAFPPLKPNNEGSDYEVNSDEVLRGGDICGNGGQTIDQADYPNLGNA